MKGARILNVTPEEYLADPCETPSLNSGTADRIVNESPLHAWTHHPRLGGTRAAGTKAMDDGAVLHRLLLGKGKDIVVVEAQDFRTNAAKDARDAAIKAGKTPVIAHKFAEFAAIAAKLRDACLALDIEFDGQSEVAIEFTDIAQGGRQVLCRAMLDHVHLDRAHVIDIKKVRSARPRDIERSFVEYGYHIQQHAYTRAIELLEPEFEGRVDFQFLFMEIEPPYSVVPGDPDGRFREIGMLQWMEALHRWRECLDSGRWPGYCDGRITLSPPAYIISQYLGNME